MKSNKQRITDLLVKRCVRFLKSNPDMSIFPHTFHKAENGAEGKTCLLGVILSKNKKFYEEQLSLEARQDAADILGLELNDIMNLENGFSSSRYWYEPIGHKYSFDTEFTEIGNNVYTRVKRIFSDRVDSLYRN